MSVFLHVVHSLLGLHQMILDNKGKHVQKLLNLLSAPHLPFFVLIYYLSWNLYFSFARWCSVGLLPQRMLEGYWKA